MMINVELLEQIEVIFSPSYVRYNIFFPRTPALDTGMSSGSLPDVNAISITEKLLIFVYDIIFQGKLSVNK
jgi:hypothetical protein